MENAFRWKTMQKTLIRFVLFVWSTMFVLIHMAYDIQMYFFWYIHGFCFFFFVSRVVIEDRINALLTTKICLENLPMDVGVFSER